MGIFDKAGSAIKGITSAIAAKGGAPGAAKPVGGVPSLGAPAGKPMQRPLGGKARSMTRGGR